MEFTALPNGDRAVVDLAKLYDYCLNPYHQDGKLVKNSEWSLSGEHRRSGGGCLQYALAQPFGIGPAHSQRGLENTGLADFVLTTASGSAVVRSGWIVRHGEDSPRLTTCYVKIGAKR